MAKKKEDAKEAKETMNAQEFVMPASVKEKCISCNTSVVNDAGSVKFPCPNCGKFIIIRCSKCRKIVTKYKCPVCGFEGPN